MFDRQPISEDTFISVRNGCGRFPGSASPDWVIADPRYFFFEASLRELINSEVYSVRHAKADGSGFADYRDPLARRLTISEMLASEKLQRILNQENAFREPRSTPSRNLLSLHCNGCHARIIADGLHRISYWNANGAAHLVVKIYELSGKWHEDTPDLNLICRCRKLPRNSANR